jgi:hypothetical protein
VITLFGARYVEVAQLAEYVDEGAWVLDSVDGGWAASGDGLAALDTSLPTAPLRPFVVTFRAVDAAGNTATPVTRTVVVLAKCPPPSFLCDEQPVCATCVDGACLCLSAVEAVEEVVEPAYVPPVDGTPPEMTLLGAGERALIVGVNGGPDVPVAIERLLLGAAWVDAGASATDGVSISTLLLNCRTPLKPYTFPVGNLTEHPCWLVLQVDGAVAVSAFGAARVDSAATTAPAAPHVVSYSATDAAGNVAVARRRVHVVNPCGGEGEEEFPCLALDAAGGVCSVGGLWGPPQVSVQQYSAYTACDATTPLSVLCDRGASASDPVDGDLAPYLLACRFQFGSVGLAGCTLDTTAPGVYTIQFAAENSAGLVATAVRNVTVLITCATGEQPCSDGVSCSSGGACLADLASGPPLEATPPPPPPTLSLRTTAALGAFVDVRKGTTYAACAAGVQPTAEAPCELGAAAAAGDVDLTARVLVCPPASCVTR